MRVFLTFPQQFTGIAGEIADALKAGGYDVFNPAEFGLRNAGDNMYRVIAGALDDADIMVVLVDGATATPSNVKADLSYAFGERRFEGRLIPIFIDGTGDAPWALRIQGGVAVAATETSQVPELILDALRKIPTAA